MRVFLILCSLAAIALAKPQYNYASGVSGNFGGSSHGGGSAGLGGNFGSSGSNYQGGGGGGGGGASSHGGSSFGGGGSSFGGGGSNFGGGGSSFGSGSIGGGGSSFGSGSIGGGGSSFGGGYNNQQSHQGGFEAPLVHKQFITIAAPDDNDNLEQVKHLVIGRPQKNYRVVFIKAPSSSSANVKLSAEYAPKEEKTVIYVLAKKDSALEVNDIATPAPTIPSKPEVFFIKYKTEAEAQHAQRQIQAEYDRIEGTSEHTDAGVAPQQSVVGILGNGGNAGGGNGGNFNTGGSGSIGGGGHNAGKNSAYLPPVFV